MNFFNPKTVLNKIESYKNFKKNFPGTVLSFVHKPQTKFFYDSIPVVLGVRLIGRKMFAVNLRLVPPRERVRLLNMMYDLKYENEPRVVINKLLRSKYSKIMAATLEVYDIKNIKSKIKVLNDGDWATFALNEYNSFKNVPKNRIYKIVKQRIINIKMPVKYIVQVIKNNLKRK